MYCDFKCSFVLAGDWDIFSFELYSFSTGSVVCMWCLWCMLIEYC